MLGLFVVTVLQISVFEHFVNQRLYIYLPLLVLIYANWFIPKYESLMIAIVLGWTVSYFDALPFGVTILLFLVTAIAVQRISLTFLTNRTYGSLILAGLFGMTIYYVALGILAATPYTISFAFFAHYIASPYALITQIVLGSLVLVLFKLMFFRSEAFKT